MKTIHFGSFTRNNRGLPYHPTPSPACQPVDSRVPSVEVSLRARKPLLKDDKPLHAERLCIYIISGNDTSIQFICILTPAFFEEARFLGLPAEIPSTVPGNLPAIWCPIQCSHPLIYYGMFS